ncbi:MAG: dipeptidase [Ferruginibacter sp.]
MKIHFLICPAIILMIFAYSIAQAQQTTAIKYMQTEAEAKKIVANVLKQSPIIDGHSDLFAWYFGCVYKKLKKCPQDISDYPLDTISKGQTDIPRWRKGGVGGVQLNLDADSFNLKVQYDFLHKLEKVYQEDLKIVGTSSQMRKAMQEGKIALLPMKEGSGQLNGNILILDTLYQYGLRCMTFTYYTNEFADASDDTPIHNGISALGKDMVNKMNHLGIIIDMSHISAKSMSDILDITQAPVIFSHSNARALDDVNRNVPDSILLRLKKNGGLIMIDMVAEHTTTAFGKWAETGDSVYYSIKAKFPGDKIKLKDVMVQWEKDYPMPVVSVADVADHFDYVKKLIGIDYIGISGDYDGMDYPIPGLEDVSCFPTLLIELARRGWTKKELRKVTGENFLCVFEEVEKKAKEI